MKSVFLKFFLLALLAVVSSGCALNYSINQPTPSLFKYDSGKSSQTVIQIVDQRVDKRFFKGIGNLSAFNIKLKNVDDPVKWLAHALQSEFATREMNVQMVTGEEEGKPDLKLLVQEYQIDNYRTSGFSAWVAYHYFKGELQSPEGTYPIKAYFLYGKVPVWSMTEIQKPCLDRPMGILVKEVVSKINNSALHYRVSDSRLDAIYKDLVGKMEGNSEDAYLGVLSLGGSNNPAAMDMLVQTTESEDYLVRACSLSAMGVLGARDRFAYLKEKYESYVDIHRFMALKSIGDIGTPEAYDFLRKAKEDPQNRDEYGIHYCVDLFISQ